MESIRKMSGPPGQIPIPPIESDPDYEKFVITKFPLELGIGVADVVFEKIEEFARIACVEFSYKKESGFLSSIYNCELRGVQRKINKVLSLINEIISAGEKHP